MKRTSTFVLATALAAAGCLGSYKSPPGGNGSGVSQMGSSGGNASGSGGGSSGSGSGGGSSGSGSGGGSSGSGSGGGGSSTGAGATADAGSAPAADLGSASDGGKPAATSGNCAALIDCCDANLSPSDAAQCDAQFAHASESVCADVLARLQQQGVCP